MTKEDLIRGSMTKCSAKAEATAGFDCSSCPIGFRECEAIGVWERLDRAIDAYFRPEAGPRCFRCNDTGFRSDRLDRSCSCERGEMIHSLTWNPGC